MNEEKSFDELLESISEENIVLKESVPVENVINQTQSIKLENDADNASLVFFSNPVYLGRINQKIVNNKKESNKSDVKFYRKRLVSLFKEMIKEGEGEGEEKTKELKESHDSFIIRAINYFQIMDTKDIIQGQHFTAEQEDAAEPSDPNAFGSVLLEEPDFLSEGGEGLAERASHTLFMMRKPRNVASLDNFVITNHDLSSNELRIIPMKINIDLKSADLRVKGLKTKIKKANNQ